MNKISQKRIGVDGFIRDLNDIRDNLIKQIEGEIYFKLNRNNAHLSHADKILLNEISNKLHDLLIASAVELKKYAEYYDKKYSNRFFELSNGHWKSTDIGKHILSAFNYSHYRENILIEVARQLNVKTCPYCNMHYTLYAKEYIKSKHKVAEKGITRFQFDHFFDKLHYPMLSMSFYNLIPSCAACNQGKLNKQLALTYHPYYSNINKQFHFELTDPLGPYTAARMNDEVDISLIPESGVIKSTFKTYVDTFHLKTLYGRHGDIVQEVFDKAYEMPYYNNPSNFDFLRNRDAGYLKRLWLGNYTELEEIEKRPMAKFMQDIWKQAKGE